MCVFLREFALFLDVFEYYVNITIISVTDPIHKPRKSLGKVLHTYIYLEYENIAMYMRRIYIKNYGSPT